MMITKFRIMCLSCLLLFAACHSSRNDFSPVIKRFEENNKGKGSTALYFYPATIQMLNLDKDSLFKATTKDIKKLKILKFDTEKDSLVRQHVDKLINDIEKEQFADLIGIDQNGRHIRVMMRKEAGNPYEYAAVITDNSNVYLIDLIGSISVTALSSVLRGNLNLSGFSMVLNNPTKQRKKGNGNHP